MKYPTAAACDIAGISRQRFNEDVASGAYPCSPPAKRRVGRWFDEADLCGLYVYGFLQRVWQAQADNNHRSPIAKRVAAMYACKVIAALRSDLDGATRLDFPLNGFNDEFAARRDGEPPAFTAGGGNPDSGQIITGSEIATICFSLDGIRAAVRASEHKWRGEA